MHKTKNWDDLRFVLAVSEAGSVNAASTRLGVNHATVLRRIAAFEARHGVRIFDRDAKGYRATDASARILAAAKQVEEAYHSLERLVSGHDAQLRGTVRLTSTDTFSTTVLPDILADFRRAEPEITIEMQVTNAHVNLARLDADVTVRPAQKLPEDMIGSPAAKLGFAVFGRRDLLSQMRQSNGDPPPWVAAGALLDGSLPGRWMLNNIPQDQIVARADSFVSLMYLARAGLGLALLPCCLADRDDGLVRLTASHPEVVVDLWVASHKDMAEVPRIQAVKQFLHKALGKQKRFLLGDY